MAAFGEITVLARLDDEIRSETGVVVEGAGVVVQPLPYYAGAISTPRGLIRLRRSLRRIGSAEDVFVGRVPELVSLTALAHARAIGARTVAMFAADPRTLNTIAPGVFGRLIAQILTRAARKAMDRADAATYVSERYFQQLFPASRRAATIGRSNVILPPGWICGKARNVVRRDGSLQLVSVGTLEHRAKGMDFLFDVLDRLRRDGMAVHLTVVGEGRMRPELERIVRQRGLDVSFTGQIEDRERLKEVLDSSDVYVSGSRTEGLPRATVEGMGRALPVVSTNAGAAAELVQAPFLTPIDDVESFCGAIALLARDAEAYSEQSSRSLATAARVSEAARPERLVAFFRDEVVGDSRAR
ncbi:glycosyltransferase [Microbacterium sp. 13-71-7]|uniref:glycosyltransferase n=1 Tax=Microbacterium sp. 13-71-7 TaxID=1970399 RepID=UPI0026001FC5|nr:glycosyltransferase [Microbacterium sp. 13-71-7]